MTEVELLSFKRLSDPERKAIESLLAGVTVVRLDDRIKRQVVEIRLSGLRFPNASIAATALFLGAERWTHDARLLRAPGVRTYAPPLRETEQGD